MGGGIGIVEQWMKSNYFALVGGGKSPVFPQTQVILWDDDKFEVAGKIEMESSVKSLRIRNEE